MKRPTTLIVLALGAILTAVQAPAQTKPEGEENVNAQTSLCPRVAVSAIDKSEGKFRRRFSATRSADLTFHVRFDRSLNEEHLVTLKVFTPNGHIYRQYDIPLASGGEKRSGRTRSLPGYPYPVKVHATQTEKAGGRTFESVMVSFPVAGTTIVTSSLYGRWKVELFLDGDSERCGRPTFFHLEE
jgi:hypothetical protein